MLGSTVQLGDSFPDRLWRAYYPARGDGIGAEGGEGGNFFGLLWDFGHSHGGTELGSGPVHGLLVCYLNPGDAGS